MKKTKSTDKLPAAFRAMADNTRLRILLMLEAKPRTVGEIVDFFDLSQPTITRHLQTLLAAGLVRRARKGQHVRYELDADHLSGVCIDLVACFPCCCVSVGQQTLGSTEPSKPKASRRSIDKRNTKRLSKGKGEKP